MKHRWGGRQGFVCQRCGLKRIQVSDDKRWKWQYVRKSVEISDGRVLKLITTAGTCKDKK